MHPPGGRGDAISSALPEADLTGTPYSAAMRAAALIAPLASAGEGKIARSIGIGDSTGVVPAWRIAVRPERVCTNGSRAGFEVKPPGG
jgi:hypothetical protein